MFQAFFLFSCRCDFSSQLVHSLLGKEIVVDDTYHHELWFGIGRCKTRFSTQEFCLVIGLRLSPLSNIFNDDYVPIVDGINKRYF